ncbi:malate dehydrogenase [Candidatus Nitronereus thalassa]|uniref:Malate dehydrogenase n=1 Tax=Candidatus Nitronereus thalassa TaxID=3020898 RepID=A0ABU3K7A8_9BACT|nr:malate dehydrogenase [Candidatus Nitronereus thalassa]MDT7042238.1 malate dehydrogenase [Candidatus Nitronereus thalassa]
MSRQKITIVGAGNVGGSAAQRLAEREGYAIALVDIVEGLPQGKALDLAQAGAVCGYDSEIVGTNNYDATANSDVVVITSGMARKPGMSRSELLEKNTKIVRSVVQEIVPRSPSAVLVIVSNPLDAMTHVAHRVSGFPKERVVGMAGVLDSARFSTFIAQELNVSVLNVHAMVLGGHGDAMVPLVRYTTVSGRPVDQWMSKEKLEEIVTRTRSGGAEIVNLLKTGSAFYAPAAAAVEMVEAIIKDEHKVLPCAARCEGEYGLKGTYMGVPVRLGKNGVEEILEYELTAEEKSAFDTSAKGVQELCDEVDGILDAG